jgi:hypothetical protein
VVVRVTDDANGFDRRGVDEAAGRRTGRRASAVPFQALNLTSASKQQFNLARF